MADFLGNFWSNFSEMSDNVKSIENFKTRENL